VAIDNSIKALAFDLDDTLLNSAKQIGTRKAVDDWLKRDRIVILATSRPVRAVKRFIPESLMKHCWVITLNGAVSQYGSGEPSIHARLGNVAKEIVGHPGFLESTHLSIEFAGVEFATNRSFTEDELDIHHSATPEMVVPMGEVDFDSVTKIAIDGLGHSIIHHADWIRKGGGSPIPALDGTFLNVVHPSVDKATTLRLVLDSIGIQPEEMIAFGDDIPDLGMLELAGVKIAMGNAKSEVKAIADEVISDCDQDAIGSYIQRYL